MIILFVLLIYQIKETLYIGILTQLLDSCLLDRLKWPYQKLKLNIFLKALNHIVRVHPYRSSWTAVGLYCHHFLEILQNLKMRTFKFTRFQKLLTTQCPEFLLFCDCASQTGHDIVKKKGIQNLKKIVNRK